MSFVLAELFAIIRNRSPTMDVLESACLICKFYVPHTSFRIDEVVFASCFSSQPN